MIQLYAQYPGIPALVLHYPESGRRVLFLQCRDSLSAGLTMWQMWQMPRASGLRGASGSRENFFQPVSRQVIRHNFCNKKIKMGRIDIGTK